MGCRKANYFVRLTSSKNKFKVQMQGGKDLVADLSRMFSSELIGQSIGGEIGLMTVAYEH
ncbi:MAG TPA: hypothetical protein VHH94_01265 [Gammaproteobacteria bacterium]|nr:hypothetical protein [Gammaproteobacteria bacterium]